MTPSMIRSFALGPAGFMCECSIMLAGNGLDCGTDKDGDGLPDQSLNCQGSSCVRDNCIDIPNSNQVKYLASTINFRSLGGMVSFFLFCFLKRPMKGHH